MQQIILSLSFLFFSLNAFSQERSIPYPRLSPFQKTEIKVGLCDLKLEYCRPSMKGREIFGGLVPYDTIWRTGANKNSKLTFSKNILVGEKMIEAGAYSIFTVPGEKEWEVYFYDELDEYGLPDTLDNEKIITRFSVPSISLDRKIESLAINFENVTSNSVSIVIAWEQTMVLIPIKIPTDDIIKEVFEKEWEMLAEDYRTAAGIYLNNEKDYTSALMCIDKAISISEKGKSMEEYLKIADRQDRHLPYSYVLRTEILTALNETEKAIAAAEKSLMMAKWVKDDYYTKRTEANLKVLRNK